MNNKGFGIIESIVVTTVILVSLLSMYTFIQTLITNYNIKNKYDSVNNIYKLNTIRTYIYAYGNINTVIKYGEDNKKNKVLLKNLSFNESNLTTTYNNLLDDMKIEKIYYFHIEYDNNNKNPKLDNISQDNINLYNYIKYASNKYKDKYRLVAQFENGEYAQIKLWKVSDYD